MWCLRVAVRAPVQGEVHGAGRLAVALPIGRRGSALPLLPRGRLLGITLLRQHAELALDDL